MKKDDNTFPLFHLNITHFKADQRDSVCINPTQPQSQHENLGTSILPVVKLAHAGRVSVVLV